MQINFRIECPHCHWGVGYKDSYVNKGFLKIKCDHCKKVLFFKITVMGVLVEVSKELPEGLPCESLLDKEDELKSEVHIPSTASEETLYLEIKRIIAEKLDIYEDKIKPETNFIEDLKTDSLDLVELVMAFEDTYNIEIPTEDAERLLTVKEVYDYLFIRIFKTT
jgi:acyl carrier protein